MRTRIELSVLLVLAGAAGLGAACSATGGTSGFDTDPGGAGGDGAGVGGAGSVTGPSSSSSGDLTVGTGTSTGAGGARSDCSEATKKIYVVGQDNQFFSFDPPTLELKPLGILSCPGNTSFATPFSMAVDRQGIAWVLFSDGKIYHVDVSNVACTPTSFVPGQQGLLTFGMGFVSDTSGGDTETLYVADYNGSGIAKIDTTTLQLGFIGPYDKLTGSAELTGTGDARLFGFFLGTGVTVAEIDKTSGKILSQAPQPTVTIGSGWAFAFWGGDFYLFTNPNGTSSQIDKYAPMAGMTTTIKTALGSNIVGAGVSTCAPFVPPS